MRFVGLFICVHSFSRIFSIIIVVRLYFFWFLRWIIWFWSEIQQRIWIALIDISLLSSSEKLDPWEDKDCSGMVFTIFLKFALCIDHVGSLSRPHLLRCRFLALYVQYRRPGLIFVYKVSSAVMSVVSSFSVMLYQFNASIMENCVLAARTWYEASLYNTILWWHTGTLESQSDAPHLCEPPEHISTERHTIIDEYLAESPRLNGRQMENRLGPQSIRFR